MYFFSVINLLYRNHDCLYLFLVITEDGLYPKRLIKLWTLWRFSSSHILYLTFWYDITGLLFNINSEHTNHLFLSLLLFCQTQFSAQGVILLSIFLRFNPCVWDIEEFSSFRGLHLVNWMQTEKRMSRKKYHWFFFTRKTYQPDEHTYYFCLGPLIKWEKSVRLCSNWNQKSLLRSAKTFSELYVWIKLYVKKFYFEDTSIWIVLNTDNIDLKHMCCKHLKLNRK